MFVTYPNLELIDYKASLILSEDKEFSEKLGKRIPEYNLEVFPQIWSSTCTGFDICSDGSPAIGGCAMTREYTTVVHEVVTDTYLVFFGNHPCYMVTEPNENFYSDLSARNMASLSKSKKRY